jgi:hypothetical protein
MILFSKLSVVFFIRYPCLFLTLFVGFFFAFHHQVPSEFLLFFAAFSPFPVRTCVRLPCT